VIAARIRSTRAGSAEQFGQAVVELALVLPVLLLLTLAVLGIDRVTQAHMAARAIAWEAARAAALASSANGAAAQGAAEGMAVAEDYHLQRSALHVTVDASQFRRGGQVSAAVRYDVSLADLPLLGRATVRVGSDHTEPVDPYRSGLRGDAS